MLLALRRVLMRTMQMPYVTAVNIMIPKRVRFILGQGIITRLLVDLFQEIALREI